MMDYCLNSEGCIIKNMLNQLYVSPMSKEQRSKAVRVKVC